MSVVANPAAPATWTSMGTLMLEIPDSLAPAGAAASFNFLLAQAGTTATFSPPNCQAVKMAISTAVNKPCSSDPAMMCRDVVTCDISTSNLAPGTWTATGNYCIANKATGTCPFVMTAPVTITVAGAAGGDAGAVSSAVASVSSVVDVTVPTVPAVPGLTIPLASASIPIIPSVVTQTSTIVIPFPGAASTARAVVDPPSPSMSPMMTPDTAATPSGTTAQAANANASGSSSSTGSNPNMAPIIGGVLGAAVIAGVVVFTLWYRQVRKVRRRRTLDGPAMRELGFSKAYVPPAAPGSKQRWSRFNGSGVSGGYSDIDKGARPAGPASSGYGYAASATGTTAVSEGYGTGGGSQVGTEYGGATQFPGYYDEAGAYHWYSSPQPAADANGPELVWTSPSGSSNGEESG